MSSISRIIIMCAVVLSPAVWALHAYAASVAELATCIDRAEGPADYARFAAQLDVIVSGKGPEAGAAVVQLARANYLLGEAETVTSKRIAYLDRAVELSERALKQDPGNAVALYWRSMSYLQKADIEGGLSALGMVKRALKDFEKVEAAEPAYDGAGAYRSHGKVLMEAPGWAFIGDKDRGVELLEKSKDIAPRSLLNRLYLAEAYADMDRPDDAAEELDYIAKAPLGAIRQMDDIKIKEDAARLMKKLRR